MDLEGIKMSVEWEGKKLHLGQPLSFTSYRLENGVLIERTGLFNIKERQVQLYRILDVAFEQDMIDNLCNQGTIKLSSNSKFDNITLENVGDPREVKRMLNEEINNQRSIKGVRTGEVIDNNTEITMDFEDGHMGTTHHQDMYR